MRTRARICSGESEGVLEDNVRMELGKFARFERVAKSLRLFQELREILLHHFLAISNNTL